MHFLPAGGVHLFPDDIFDFPQHPPAQRQVGINAGRQLIDHPGPNQ